MPKPKLSLQPSESVVTHVAGDIYAAYIAAGRVTDGQEEKWMQRSIAEAIKIAQMTDEAVLSDSELG